MHAMNLWKTSGFGTKLRWGRTLDSSVSPLGACIEMIEKEVIGGEWPENCKLFREGLETRCHSTSEQ